jgi:exosortase
MAAVSTFLLGKANFERAAFPVGFLFLMVPLPEAAVRSFTLFLQHASANAAYVLISMTGTPVFRDGLVFTLPGLELVVAEECSGIRSTLVLLITSLLAGHLFLRKPWGKWMLAMAVVPIGILRNGFRIMTISWLTVNVDHGIIDGPIHHQGGPFFFVLSLLPLLGLLVWLRRLEERGGAASRPN